MLACKTQGEGNPLVFLHAFPLSSAMWKKEIEIFSAQFKVIAPDLPGFGQSARPADSVAAMASEVASLLDHLQITKPVILAGLSMGGYAALEFYRQFPSRVRGLGLFATRATPDTPEAKQKRMLSIEAIEKFGIDPFARKIVKSQLGKTTQDSNPALIEQVTSMMKEAKPESAIAALRAMADRRDNTDILGQIKFPVLVVAGQEDEIAPAEEMRKMNGQIPGSEFHAVAESGHLVNLEQPAVFHGLLNSFLNRFQ